MTTTFEQEVFLPKNLKHGDKYIVYKLRLQGNDPDDYKVSYHVSFEAMTKYAKDNGPDYGYIPYYKQIERIRNMGPGFDPEVVFQHNIPYILGDFEVGGGK